MGRSFRVADMNDDRDCNISDELVLKLKFLEIVESVCEEFLGEGCRLRLTPGSLSETNGEKDAKDENICTPSRFIADRIVW